jgi:hypothetical protein
MGNHHGWSIEWRFELTIEPRIALTKQLEISPQGTPKKPNTINYGLVIIQHLDVRRPFDATQAHTYVSRKNDDVRVSFRWDEVCKFCVQVAEDMKLLTR